MKLEDENFSGRGKVWEEKKRGWGERKGKKKGGGGSGKRGKGKGCFFWRSDEKVKGVGFELV